MNTYNLQKLQEFRSDLNKINSELKKCRNRTTAVTPLPLQEYTSTAQYFHLKGSIDCAKIINNIGEEVPY